MANLITQTRVDDLLYTDGETIPAAETVYFNLDGKEYCVDLTHENAAVFRDLLAPYIKAARRTKGGKRSRPEMHALRSWARQHGWDLSDRGRIPDEVRRAYEARDRSPVSDGPADVQAEEIPLPADVVAEEENRSFVEAEDWQNQGL